jgi:PST family polysaccharide transporter
MFPLGVCLQSSYIYQARQNNIPLALFIVAPRIASVIVAVVLIESDSTPLLVVLILSSSYLASGVISTLYLARKIEFVSPFALGWDPFLKIREGRALFIAGVSVILYRGSNTLLLGLMSAGALSISYYAIAEKYVRMLQAISFPLSQMYSVQAIERLSGMDKSRPIPVLWDNTKYPVLLSIVAISILAIFGVGLSIFDSFAIPRDVVFIFFMMVWAVPFGVGNYMFGSIGLSVLQRERRYAVAVFMTGLMAVALSLLLIPKYVEYGAAFSYIFAEMVLFLIVFSLLRREG